eukprot:6608037-Lingulodinium_polyedra.AAC.1
MRRRCSSARNTARLFARSAAGSFVYGVVPATHQHTSIAPAGKRHWICAQRLSWKVPASVLRWSRAAESVATPRKV